MMSLTVVGVTGSMSGPASPASCYLLQAEGTDSLGLPHTYSVVFDLGPGSFGQIWNYTIHNELNNLCKAQMRHPCYKALVSDIAFVFSVFSGYNCNNQLRNT